MKLNLFHKLPFLRCMTSNQQVKNEMDDTKTNSITEGFERCVVCGELTAVPISTPIDWRDNYEIGCGQLCIECAKKQQKAVKRENTLTTAQIRQAVEQIRQENNK